MAWIVERLDALWPGGLRWEHDAGEHPHEARYLKVDSAAPARGSAGRRAGTSSRRSRRSSSGTRALRDGADMRAVTLAQLEAFSRANTLTAR